MTFAASMPGILVKSTKIKGDRTEAVGQVMSKLICQAAGSQSQAIRPDAVLLKAEVIDTKLTKPWHLRS